MEMPPRGYKNLSISQKVYDQITKFIEEENAKAGYDKYRSVQHFVEEAVMFYLRLKRAGGTA